MPAAKASRARAAERPGGPARVGPVQEYETLRQELLEAKRFVFERPLLIGALAIAALNAVGPASVAVVPVLLAALLLFNFWFTANRLYSSARIVAYIHLQLEGEIAPWRGWETRLWDYRVWLDDPANQRRIEAEVRQRPVPDNSMYYPPIYGLHVGLAGLAAGGSVWIVRVQGASPLTLTCLALTLALIAAMIPFAVRYRPRHMLTLIERNRAIWRAVLGGGDAGAQRVEAKAAGAANPGEGKDAAQALPLPRGDSPAGG